MKIKKSLLRRIVQEELSRSLKEQMPEDHLQKIKNDLEIKLSQLNNTLRDAVAQRFIKEGDPLSQLVLCVNDALGNLDILNR